MTYHCHKCGKENEIVNQCGCDPNNMPTTPVKKRKPTAPRIGEQSAKFYPTVFSSLNSGMVFIGDAFPVLYRRTIHDLRGTFSRGELMLIIDVFNSTTLLPELAGQQLDIQVADGISLGGLDKKWEIDGQELNAEIATLPIFARACLEIWANGFWYRQRPEDPLDLEAWVAPLL